MSVTFTVQCHRLAAQRPYLPWAEITRRVSEELRLRRMLAKKAAPPVPKKLWYADK